MDRMHGKTPWKSTRELPMYRETSIYGLTSPEAKSSIFLMLLYLLRAAGDLKAEALSLISPLGLILRTEVYAGNNWRPIWIVLGISLLAAGLALYLAKIRDLGSGLLPARPGRARAGKLLSTPLGLAFRLSGRNAHC